MKTNLFDDAFPFTGLFRRQAGTLREAVKRLESILRNFTMLEDKCGRISGLVLEGEKTCRQIERELSLTFIHPLDREDIRELSRAFQRAIQAVGAASNRIFLYEFRESQKGAAAHATCLAEMADEIAPLLEVIVRKGTGAANCERFRELKRQADAFLLVGLGEVYESADRNMGNLLETMKWSQIYDRLEEAASSLEYTVNVIEGIVLKKV